MRSLLVLSSALVLVACRSGKSAPDPARGTTDASASTTSPVAARASASLPTATSSVVSPPRLAPAAPMDAGGAVYDMDDGGALAAWVEGREDAATAPDGAELVRVPLVHKGNGWGCICPDYYLGTMTNTAGDRTVWIEPTFEPTAKPIPPDAAVVAEGYFTGKREPFKPSTSEPFEKATVHGFRVLRHRPTTEASDEAPGNDRRATVLYAGKDAHQELGAAPEGNGYLLVAASVPHDGAKAAAVAERRRAELAAKGIDKAEVIDSRIAPGLFCCHLVVLAGRFATEADASAAAAALKKKGISVLVRRGW